MDIHVYVQSNEGFLLARQLKNLIRLPKRWSFDSILIHFTKYT